MSDAERNQLLELLEKATEEAKNYSPQEAMQKLVDEGFYTPEGKLAEKYGGKSSSQA